MGILQKALERFVQRYVAPSLSSYHHGYTLFGGYSTHAGQTVSEENALCSSAVYACTRIISSTFAGLPCNVYQELPAGGKSIAREHELFELLHYRPNPWMTSFDFREAMMVHYCLWGNAYAAIIRSPDKRVIALYPMLPRCVEVEVGTGRVFYKYTPDNGSEPQVLGDDEVLHIHNMGLDGYRGLSPIVLARQSLGIGLAAEAYAGRFFGNSTVMGGYFEHPGQLSAEAQKRLIEAQERRHRGDGQHLVGVLEEGMKFKEVGLAPEAAQLLATRQFQLTDIARVYGVPPHKIGDLTRSTNNNIEHQAIEFVQDAILPPVCRWEQSIKAKFFMGTPYYVKFRLDGLLRGDYASRTKGHSTMLLAGAMTPNEVRELEDLNPMPGGDVLRTQMQMVPLGTDPVDQQEA